MPITTKTGDKGNTSLLYGGRVRKDSLRIEACGTLDELNSFLGLSKCLVKDSAAKKIIDKMQNDLFIIGSEVVCGKPSIHKIKKRISQGNVKGLELFIGRLEKRRKVKRCNFVLPGANTISASLDIARTVARRAERKIVTLRNKRMVRSRHILVYLNRLSDLLYLMARSYEK